MPAAIPESQAGTSNEITHGARHQHLTRGGCFRHARGDVHRDASDIVRCHLYLSGMKPAAHLDPERPQSIGYRGSASHSTGRPVECREKAVAEVLHSASAEPFDLLPHSIIVALEQSAPVPV